MEKDNGMQEKESIEFLIKSTDMFEEKDFARLDAQVNGHKYFLGQQLRRDISWEEAMYSWMENVYLPISEAMETPTTEVSFSGKRRADVFFALCDHWYYLSKDHGNTGAFDATLDFDANFGSPLGKLLARLQGNHSVA